MSKNNTRTCWVLKCDIKKFFASIDHKILSSILAEYVSNKEIMELLEKIICSFRTITANSPSPPLSEEGDTMGLPLGNLTSQLFANVYMNTFDQWVKHRLGVETPCMASLHYMRYADDFVFLLPDKKQLEFIIPQIQKYLASELKLTLHPDKVSLKTIASGVDYLGWALFPRHRVLRNNTKRRMFARVSENPAPETLQSYLGLLRHGDTKKIQRELLAQYWLCH